MLTVASTTDWKASTGGRAFRRPVLPRRRICACTSVDSRHDWSAALAGNELYLNGLYSGITSSQRAFSKYGIGPRRLITRASHANGATPIIGEISTRRVGGAARRARRSSSAYFKASAPPFE